MSLEGREGSVRPRAIADVLGDRAALAGLALPEALSGQLLCYYELLTHWNRTINLTSLSDVDEAVDRLLLEPVAASAFLPHRIELVDLGSGGGSPAVPLALATEASRLVMIESRARKAAFLREVARELALAGTVEAARFEAVANNPDFAGRFGLASVRAVRMDPQLFQSIEALLRPHGYAALFRGVETSEPDRLPPSLTPVSSHPLVAASRSALTVLQRS
jgi:16S rRNA (guanine527-N7)-methyltransferase